MFNDLERFFNLLDWDASMYQYNRPTLDSKPYQIVKDKEGKKSTIIFNALGIEKKDIKISVDRQNGQDYLTITGDTKNELLNRTYSVSGRFRVESDSIDEINYYLKNGLLFIEIGFKEPEAPKFKINAK